jgi:gliding motility-associated-like protein
VVAPSSSTTYSVTVANGNCSSTASTSVTVNPSPTANAGANITIDYGSGTTLTASGGGNYSWSTGEITQTISVSPTATTVYCVTVTNASGCTDSSCVTVKIDFNCGDLFIPNAFSPNGDMKNDFFVPRDICFKSLNLAIYDRWGVRVFETQDIHSKGWDGTYKGEIGTSAVFGYTFSYELVDGTSGEKKGTVSLIR